jgi:hypothetical protein
MSVNAALSDTSVRRAALSVAEISVSDVKPPKQLF